MSISYLNSQESVQSLGFDMDVVLVTSTQAWGMTIFDILVLSWQNRMLGHNLKSS